MSQKNTALTGRLKAKIKEIGPVFFASEDSFGSLRRDFLSEVSRGFDPDLSDPWFHLWVLRKTGMLEPPFRVLRCRYSELWDGEQNHEPECTISVSARGREEMFVGSGDGPVNACEQALKKALDSFFQKNRDIEQIKLVDFDLHSLDAGEKGSAAAVRVLVTFEKGQERWTTMGVSVSMVEASWQAVFDAFLYASVVLKVF